ncbi:hypothetical protein O6H91_09G040000 [Diphasiastrum complanatum]|uniref:Uncharacterized protein n=1 Tax=Diphasiastrum complanatum TaxID=34168 RepID=A0ACC2CN83_DIPCM|nr:hypothetical protein O6H91_09G040000 [Diphasiastrum complanatum]
MSFDGRDVVVALLVLVVAGVCEIGGGWLVWKWRKEGWQWAFGLLGSILLVVYGVIPTLQRQIFSRIYAAYGGFFIVLALLWGWIAEKSRPDVWDILGACIALVGVCIIMFAPRPR